jgi:hypothetical protein
LLELAAVTKAAATLVNIASPPRQTTKASVALAAALLQMVHTPRQETKAAAAATPLLEMACTKLRETTEAVTAPNIIVYIASQPSTPTILQLVCREKEVEEATLILVSITRAPPPAISALHLIADIAAEETRAQEASPTPSRSKRVTAPKASYKYT